MASITLKNIPDDLRLKLKAQAKRNGRSLNQEVIMGLPKLLTRDDRVQELVKLREHRDRLAAKGLWLTEQDVQRDRFRDTF